MLIFIVNLMFICDKLYSDERVSKLILSFLPSSNTKYGMQFSFLGN